MSGVAALLERGQGAPPGLIDAMLAGLAHRGPDRSAVAVRGHVALGQCMLETTPEDALDRQPLCRRSPSGGELCIAADARLDNRDDLLAARASAGLPRGPVSDAEIILWAYEQWGEACAAKLIGDFAFVVWDAGRGHLFCARDHLGVRPLYYREDAHGFRCASEMQALFADHRVPRRVHAPSVSLFLAYEYGEQGDTLWDGVRALPSGHTLVVSSRGVALRRYWTPDPSGHAVGRTPEERAEQFRAVFTEAVRCRLRSSRPLAGHVSGGLDSSSVVSVAARLHAEGRVSGPPVTPVRLCFPGLACDEAPYSQAVADRWGLSLVTCHPLLRPDLCRPDPRRSAGDAYFHPTIAVKDVLFEAARERGIRTTLTGTGSDQLLHRTGFECASLLLRREVGKALAEARHGLAAPAAFRTLVSTGILPLLPWRLQEAVRRARGARSTIPWLSPSAAREVAEGGEAARKQALVLHPDPAVAHLMQVVMHGPDLGLGLARLGRHAAHHGEERHPFLDVRVVELLLAFPCEERFERGVKKPVLRRAMAETLPPLVRDRRDSADFTSYVQEAFFQPFRVEIRGLFDASLLEAGGFVDGAALRRALDEGASAGAMFHVVNLIALELWLRCAQQ